MNPPTLDPFPSRSKNDIPLGSLAITAIILGIATTFIVLYFNYLGEDDEKKLLQRIEKAKAALYDARAEEARCYAELQNALRNFENRNSNKSSSPAAPNPLSDIFSESLSDKMKDWDFYTADIGSALQELQQAKEKYEQQSKDLVQTELRRKAEKEDLARIRKEIETMRNQLTTEIHSIASSKATTPSPTSSPTTPQKPQ